MDLKDVCRIETVPTWQELWDKETVNCLKTRSSLLHIYNYSVTSLSLAGADRMRTNHLWHKPKLKSNKLTVVCTNEEASFCTDVLRSAAEENIALNKFVKFLNNIYIIN